MGDRQAHFDGWGDSDRALMPVGEAPVVLPSELAVELDKLRAGFAEQMGEGLMAASVAIGLDVLHEMMQVEVTDAQRTERCSPP